jgi:hypothetical protein
MKADYHNVFEFLDLLLSKVESIEYKISDKNDEHKYKEYMSVDELLEYLKDNAILVSKSKIYKLTASSGGIPFRRVYGRLVFKKQEIDLWIDSELNPRKKRNNDVEKIASRNNKKNINIKNKQL